MIKPRQNRSLRSLDVRFSGKLRAWLAAAQGAGFHVLVYETKRTLERQKWLYAAGRTRRGAIVTYTIDSCHRYGCAVDLVPLDARGRANWNGYAALYRAVPPSRFGLELLDFERPHLQIKGGQKQARAWGISPA